MQRLSPSQIFLIFCASYIFQKVCSTCLTATQSPFSSLHHHTHLSIVNASLSSPTFNHKKKKKTRPQHLPLIINTAYTHTTYTRNAHFHPCIALLPSHLCHDAVASSSCIAPGCGSSLFYGHLIPPLCSQTQPPAKTAFATTTTTSTAPTAPRAGCATGCTSYLLGRQH